MFMGEYNHTVDTKGRLIIPSKFRETLGDKFVITKGLDGCLFAYDNAGWSVFEEKLSAMPISRKDTRMFVRIFWREPRKWRRTSREGCSCLQSCGSMRG